MIACRACGSDRLLLFLPLGDHPPANAFLLPEQLAQETSFPLDALVCLECALIQVANRIPPDFYKHYLYTPAAADGLRAHFARLADHLVAKVPEGGLVVDVGCNVGLLLDACRARGVRCVGVDPADNLTEVARANGHDVLSGPFDRAHAEEARERFGAASLIVTTNTFNHIDDLHAFMEAVAILVSDDGLFVVEVPHSGDLVAMNAFDTIYQEHLSELSVHSFVALCRATGFEVIDVEALAIHGGSMRITMQRARGQRTAGPVVSAWLARERSAGLFERATYERFAERVSDNRRDTLALIARLRAEGAELAGYGAPAKGNTLLIHYGLGAETLAFIADRNELKHGRLTPRMHVPVVPVHEILARQPDYLLVLAWNFADEIFAQQAEYVRRGGKFIVPIPAPRIAP